MDQDPAPDLVPVADPEVDAAELAAEMRQIAAAHRSAGRYADVFADEQGVEPTPLRVGPRISAAAEHAEILAYGEIVAPPKRAVRRALRWLLWPVTAHMSRHNRAAADVLAEHERQVAWLYLELERVRRNTDLLSAAPPE